MKSIRFSACNDGIDQDGDTWSDFEDPDCIKATAEALQDGDFACNDLLDNDSDGLIDSDDPDCLFAKDNLEAENVSNCTDGIDNDGDGWVDDQDPECFGVIPKKKTMHSMLVTMVLMQMVTV